MNMEELLTGLDQLQREHGAVGTNIGCVEVERSIACSDCVFSSDCGRCHRLRYSVSCHDSYDLTHCARCTCCYSSSFAEDCNQCVSCSHVVLCTSCSRCDYCFGCVGLVGKDFHILNRKYSRGEYFRTVKAFKEELAADI